MALWSDGAPNWAFKELKRVYKLDVIHSGKREMVEALVLVAMLALVVSLRHTKLLKASRSR
ncbi:MAG: hypothetical protein AB1576_10910 [Bacillota bacterium]